MLKEKQLTKRQAVFIDEYLRTWNATEASRRAGYKGGEETLSTNGCRLLKHPNVRDAIETRIQELSEQRGGEVSRHIEKNVYLRSRAKMETLYLLREEHGAYKIGVAANVIARIAKLSSLIPYELDVVMSVDVENPLLIEKELHFRFKDKRIKGEWFRLTPEDVEWIQLEYGNIE